MKIERSLYFPHIGRNDLQAGDYVVPHMLTDQAHSAGLRQRYTPAIQCGGRFLGMGNTDLMFELIDGQTEFLCVLEYQIRTFALMNFKAEFGIFANPNIRQVIHWGFVDVAQWQVFNGPLGYASPVTVSDYQRHTIRGQFDPQLFTPGQSAFAFLRVEMAGLPAVPIANQDAPHPETGELLPIGVHGVTLYTGS